MLAGQSGPSGRCYAMLVGSGPLPRSMSLLWKGFPNLVRLTKVGSAGQGWCVATAPTNAVNGCVSWKLTGCLDFFDYLTLPNQRRDSADSLGFYPSPSLQPSVALVRPIAGTEH